MNASEKHPSKFKAAFKELLPAYIITFVFCYMLFVYEPVLMYSTNQIDLWFDLVLMIRPVLIGFALTFFGSAVLMTAVFLINKAVVREKEPTAYRIVTIALFFVFLVTYIQGNFLAGDLPALDGSEIDWDSFLKNDLITLSVCVILLCVAVILLIKFKVKRAFMITAFAAGAVFLMLTVSLVFEMINRDAFARKDSVVATMKDFNTISSDKNFVIILNDAVDAVEFGNVLEENPEYKKVFEDFTYFPDTLGCYPCTRDTIPVVLGGALNKNEMKFEDFSTRALNDSPLFEELTEKGYDINLYESPIVWYGNKNFSINNCVDNTNYDLPFGSFFREEIKYIGYKYLPYRFKRYSDIESMDYNDLVEWFRWNDNIVYGYINDAPELQKQEDRVFDFVHTEGAHMPFQYDRDLKVFNSIWAGNYKLKIEATITMTNAYIERLKANGVYDNTVIIIMADHGNTTLSGDDGMLKRANPLFMVKGINEHHEFEVSEKPLSYLDLMDIYSKLLDDRTAKEATDDIPDERERIFLWYKDFEFEDHIVEYAVTDKAWEWEKFRKTGNEYDL